MNKNEIKLFAILAISAAIFFAACSGGSSYPAPVNPPEPKAQITRIDENYADINDSIDVSGVTATLVYPTSTIVGMRFVYPFKDPYGNPVMLSGMICVPKTIYNQKDKKAQGIMLYNHYTIMKYNECPSYGVVEGKGPVGLKEISGLGMKVSIARTEGILGLNGHKIITVAADYYGFGETKDQVQYYCEGDYNARASLEALKAAKELLKEKGYSWDDYLLNVGYSQGGQTAIAVQKLVDKGEYAEKISATFAGSGPYDLMATYRSYLAVKDQERDISVVIYPVLSFNEHKALGIDYSKAFRPRLAKNIDEWFLSKKFTSDEIDQKMKSAGLKTLEDSFSDELLDETTEMAKKVTSALDTVNLTKGWTPNKNDRIYLYYSEADTLVPPVNGVDMIQFLEAKGFAIEEKEASLLSMLGYILEAPSGPAAKGDPDARPAAGKVIVRKSVLADGVSHQAGGAFWLMDVLSELKQQFVAKN